MSAAKPTRHVTGENFRDTDQDTISRHRQLQAGLRRLQIGRAGPRCAPSRDGLVVVYGEPDSSEERPA